MAIIWSPSGVHTAVVGTVWSSFNNKLTIDLFRVQSLFFHVFNSIK